MRSDPDQFSNLAGDTAYARYRKQLAAQLDARLRVLK